LNPYGYVMNNPMNRVDPTGLFDFGEFLGGLGGLLGGVDLLPFGLFLIPIDISIYNTEHNHRRTLIIRPPPWRPPPSTLQPTRISAIQLQAGQATEQVPDRPDIQYTSQQDIGCLPLEDCGEGPYRNDPNDPITGAIKAFILYGLGGRSLVGLGKVFVWGGRAVRAAPEAEAAAAAARAAAARAAEREALRIEREISRKIFGKGLEGAERVLTEIEEGRFELPRGATRQILENARKTAQSAIDRGRDVEGIQAMRVKIIDKILERFGSQLP